MTNWPFLLNLVPCNSSAQAALYSCFPRSFHLINCKSNSSSQVSSPSGFLDTPKFISFITHSVSPKKHCNFLHCSRPGPFFVLVYGLLSLPAELAPHKAPAPPRTPATSWSWAMELLRQPVTMNFRFSRVAVGSGSKAIEYFFMPQENYFVLFLFGWKDLVSSFHIPSNGVFVSKNVVITQSRSLQSNLVNRPHSNLLKNSMQFCWDLSKKAISKLKTNKLYKKQH